MSYDAFISGAVRVVEVVGAAIMIFGGLAALVVFVVAVTRPATRPGAYKRLRQNLGRGILLGLEILIVGDIVRTIIVTPTLRSVTVLGVIVAIRIVLSFSLEVEMDGTWPWSQWRLDRGKMTTPGDQGT